MKQKRQPFGFATGLGTWILELGTSILRPLTPNCGQLRLTTLNKGVSPCVGRARRSARAVPLAPLCSVALAKEDRSPLVAVPPRTFYPFLRIFADFYHPFFLAKEVIIREESEHRHPTEIKS